MDRGLTRVASTGRRVRAARVGRAAAVAVVVAASPAAAQPLTPIAPPTPEELARIEAEVSRREAEGAPQRPRFRGFVELGLGSFVSDDRIQIGSVRLSAAQPGAVIALALGARARLATALDVQLRAQVETSANVGVSCASSLHVIDYGAGTIAAIEGGVRLRPHREVPLVIGAHGRAGLLIVGWDPHRDCPDPTSATLPLLGGVIELSALLGGRGQFDLGLRGSFSQLVAHDLGFFGVQVFAGWSFP